MQKHREVTERHIAAYATEISKRIYGPFQPIDIEAYEVPGEPVSYEAAVAGKYTPFAVGQSWGRHWGTTWFRFSGTVPAAWKGRKVAALVSLGFLGGEGFTVEGLIWHNGKPMRAINVNRMDVDVSAMAQPGERFEFYIEAASNPVSDFIGENELLLAKPEGPFEFTLKRAELACFNKDVFDVYYDLRSAYEAMMVLPVESPRRGQLLYSLNEAVNTMDLEDNETIVAAREIFAPLLERKNGDTVHHLSAIGHAHIDTAWLWPLRETIRKCARTFSTALSYMEEYPEYVFGCSQAQQYAWMKQYYPDIYEGIKAAIKRGQWEPIGSMWIEADCNVTSGESLVRQILYGKKFFREEFDVDTLDVWIPDVFGYSASMPQIMKKSGVQYFLTQKISWNQFNKFPHHTFEWEGIDGTRIFTHFPPADTYNAAMTPRELVYNVKNFKEHDRATRSLYVYGFGDGGGGPTIEMLEMARRYENFEGLPTVELERVRDFFPKAEKDAKDLPLWVGELYLELHRGTYTTQARTKRGNRKSEFLLRDAEFFDSVASALGTRYEYAPAEVPRAVYDVVGMDEKQRTPAGDLDRAWKLVLLNQFHDIIPGSSIHWVYLDNARDYTVVSSLGNAVVEAARGALATGIDTGSAQEPVVVFNTLANPRSEVVTLPSGKLAHVDVPACGYTTVDAAANGALTGIAAVSVSESGGNIVLDNGLLRVTIDSDGLLSSIFDLKANREVVAADQKANQFQLHEDRPLFWDAWDVDLFYKERVRNLDKAQSVKVVGKDPLRASVEVVRDFGKSRIRQQIVLDAGSPRIDFVTEVDWHEDHKFLKVAFPVEVRSSRATYEIQYGHTERPTHYNTSWDMGRFEVCAQKWADLSEPGYGVALLNDCKYGHDIFGNVIRLSLLRAPAAPDPRADRGLHHFTYSLLPHAGDFREGGVIEESYALNCPLSLAPAQRSQSGRPSTASYFSIDRPGVYIESIKPAEDGDGVVVRLYEGFGGRGEVKLSTTLPVGKVVRTDLLETEGESIPVSSGTATLTVSPFEIVTLKFKA
jgi:alpha-mannosidase